MLACLYTNDHEIDFTAYKSKKRVLGKHVGREVINWVQEDSLVDS